MAFDKPTVQQLHREVDAAVKAVLAKHPGVALQKSSGTYSDNEFRISIRLVTQGRSGDLPSEADFKQAARAYGFKPEMLGKTVSFGGERFKILGWARKRPKFPIEAENVRTGRRYKLPLEAVGGSKRPRLGARFPELGDFGADIGLDADDEPDYGDDAA